MGKIIAFIEQSGRDDAVGCFFVAVKALTALPPIATQPRSLRKVKDEGESSFTGVALDDAHSGFSEIRDEIRIGMR